MQKPKGIFVLSSLPQSVKAGASLQVLADLKLGGSVTADSDVVFEIVGISRSSWVVHPTSPFAAEQDRLEGKSRRVTNEEEFTLLAIKLAAEQTFDKGEHSYIKNTRIPEICIPSFSHKSNETEEEFSIRYVARARLQSQMDGNIISERPIEILSIPFDASVFSSLSLNDKTPRGMDVSLYASRDHWQPAKVGTLFLSVSAPPKTGVAAIFLELIQKLILPSPLSKEQVVAMGKTYTYLIPGCPPNEISNFTLKLQLPDCPPSLDQNVINVSYDLRAVLLYPNPVPGQPAEVEFVGPVPIAFLPSQQALTIREGYDDTNKLKSSDKPPFNALSLNYQPPVVNLPAPPPLMGTPFPPPFPPGPPLPPPSQGGFPGPPQPHFPPPGGHPPHMMPPPHGPPHHPAPGRPQSQQAWQQQAPMPPPPHQHRPSSVQPPPSSAMSASSQQQPQSRPVSTSSAPVPLQNGPPDTQNTTPVPPLRTSLPRKSSKQNLSSQMSDLDLNASSQTSALHQIQEERRKMAEERAKAQAESAALLEAAHDSVEALSVVSSSSHLDAKYSDDTDASEEILRKRAQEEALAVRRIAHEEAMARVEREKKELEDMKALRALQLEVDRLKREEEIARMRADAEKEMNKKDALADLERMRVQREVQEERLKMESELKIAKEKAENEKMRKELEAYKMELAEKTSVVVNSIASGHKKQGQHHTKQPASTTSKPSRIVEAVNASIAAIKAEQSSASAKTETQSAQVSESDIAETQRHALDSYRRSLRGHYLETGELLRGRDREAIRDAELEKARKVLQKSPQVTNIMRKLEEEMREIESKVAEEADKAAMDSLNQKIDAKKAQFTRDIQENYFQSVDQFKAECIMFLDTLRSKHIVSTKTWQKAVDKFENEIETPLFRQLHSKLNSLPVRPSSSQSSHQHSSPASVSAPSPTLLPHRPGSANPPSQQQTPHGHDMPPLSHASSQHFLPPPQPPPPQQQIQPQQQQPYQQPHQQPPTYYPPPPMPPPPNSNNAYFGNVNSGFGQISNPPPNFGQPGPYMPPSFAPPPPMGNPNTYFTPPPPGSQYPGNIGKDDRLCSRAGCNNLKARGLPFCTRACEKLATGR